MFDKQNELYRNTMLKELEKIEKDKEYVIEKIEYSAHQLAAIDAHNDDRWDISEDINIIHNKILDLIKEYKNLEHSREITEDIILDNIL